MRERLRKRLRQPDYPKPGAAERRIQAENNRVGFQIHGRSSLKDSRRRSPGLAEALLHLVELLRCDTHLLNMPV